MQKLTTNFYFYHLPKMRSFSLCLLPLALSHPAGLECGTDDTSRLKVGATIMGAPVVAGPAKPATGTPGVEIMSSTNKLVTFKAESVYFAAKVFGDGATLTCHEGFNNITHTANCTSQLYTVSDLAKGPQFFICDHAKASSITIGYGTGAAISLVSAQLPQ